MIWYKDNNNDIIISTRIRLARNLESIPFPNALKDKTAAINHIKNAVLNSNSTLSQELKYINLSDTSKNEAQRLAEEHLISPQMLDGKDRSVFISKDSTMSIMLMEEDHIRLQVIMPGNATDEAFDIANKIDDVLEENLDFAFDEDFGYLTSCPTNAGTGLRASYMMHLPALTLTSNINKVIASAGSLGIAVRGLYGEGTKSQGNLYQISNQTTLGLTEEEIIDRLKTVAKRISDMEKKARENLMNAQKTAISDKVYRSYGILKFSRSLTSNEAKSLLSDVMLGLSMGIIKETPNKSPLECMVLSSPAFISEDKDITPQMRDEKRAELIRENI